MAAPRSSGRRVSLSSGSLSDPSMLWQSYKAARLRKEVEVAHERMNCYLRVWLEAGEANMQSPMISMAMDLYGLLTPSLSFATQVDTVWTLSHRPSGMLAAIEEHMKAVTEQLASAKVVCQLSCPVGKDDGCSALKNASDLTKVVCRVAGCAENYGELKRSNLPNLVVTMMQTLWKMICGSPSEANLRYVLQSLSYSASCLHSILDPRKLWQHELTRRTLVVPDSGSRRRTSVFVPQGLLKMFVTMFNQPPSFLEQDDSHVCRQEFDILQLEMLHLLGAILSGSEENACQAATSDVCHLLLSLLDPREQCTPRQALALKLLTKLAHIMHAVLPTEEQISMDSAVVMNGVLNSLSPRYSNDSLVPPCLRYVVIVLEAIPALVHPPAKTEALKHLFVELGCYEKIIEAIKLLNKEAFEDKADACQLVCSMFRSFTCTMEQCPMAREAFESRVHYAKLCCLVESVIEPTEDILQEGFNMAVEGQYTYREDTHSIYNTAAVAMLVRWLKSLYNELRLWVSTRLYDLCSFGAHNKQRCCSAGLIKVIVDVLVDSQDENCFSIEVEDHLISLLEVLGSHSIRAAELKHVIGALRPLESGELPSYYYRLQKALTCMAHGIGKEGLLPLYYFDLRSSSSCIKIPGLRHFPNSSTFAFYTWVCLDYPHTKGKHTYSDIFPSSSFSKKRRVLYRFYSSSGAGFEAFFTNTLVLVVATTTKKEFTTLALTDTSLSPLEWHSVCIVHQASKRPWGRTGEVCVYIDGELKKTSAMRGPNLSDTFSSCYIGSGPPDPHAEDTLVAPPSPELTSPGSSSSDWDMSVSNESHVAVVPSASVSAEWGHMTNLRGLMSSLAIFSDTLSASTVKTLHKKGPNDLSLFQPKCPDTHELANKLFIYYHAKACKDGVCVHLTSSQLTNTKLNGQFTGHHYVTWDIKAVLNSLGGVQLLFPILEQVDYPVKDRDCDGTEQVGLLEYNPKIPSLHGTKMQPHQSFCNFDETEGVASFLRLLLSMMAGHTTNQQNFFLSEGPAAIGSLLHKVSPRQLTVQALSAIQELIEQFADTPERRHDMFKHFLFDFRIWSRPEFGVRIGHTQYLSTIVKDNMAECRRDFGVQFMLDMIRVFYSPMGSTVPLLAMGESIQLSSEERLSIRGALLSSIKLYVMTDISWEELEAILSLMTVVSDCTVQEELLRLLLNLLTSSASRHILADLLWDKGLIFLVLIQNQSMAVRLLAIKLLSNLIAMQAGNEFGPIYRALSQGTLAAAIGQMTQHDMSSSIILALLELCVGKSSSNLTEYISNFGVYMGVLQLLRKAPLMVRHTICQQVISILHQNPTQVAVIAQSAGWESLFLWLLTPFDPTRGEAEGDESPVEGQGKPAPERESNGSKQNGKRRNAFLDTGLPSGLSQSVSGGSPEGTEGERQRRSITYASSWSAAVEEASDEIWRTFAVVTETIGYILWHSVDHSNNKPPWKVWGKFFSSLDHFASMHTLIVPAHTVKHRIFSLLMNAITLDTKSPDISRSSLLEVLEQLSHLLESFVISSYPHLHAQMDEDEEVAILTLAHNFTADLDTRLCTPELLEQYLQMVKAAGLFEQSLSSSREQEIARSTTRILLACIASRNMEYHVAAATKLQLILRLPSLPKQDVYFIFGNLARILSETLQDEEGDHSHYIAATIRGLLSYHSATLSLAKCLPQVPDPSGSPTFSQDLIQYTKTQEWKNYLKDVVAVALSQYSNVLLPWLHLLTAHGRDCEMEYVREEGLRREEIFNSQNKYQEDVLSKYFELREKEIEREKSYDSLRQNEVSVALRNWRGSRRFFTGERGAWSSRQPEQYLWKLDRTENFGRMRMKLARNYNFDRHLDASHQRDLGTSLPVEPQATDTTLLSLARASGRSASLQKEEDLLLEQLWSNATAEKHEDNSSPRKEVVVRTVQCDLIQLMERMPGRLEITTSHLYFFAEQQEKKEMQQWYSTDFKVPLSQLREIHSRRYNMSRAALEIFLVDHTTYFLNFGSKKTVSKVYTSILDLRPRNLNRLGIQKPIRLLQTSGLTQKWVRWEITTFDYLIQLNTIAGRTYNDLNQYPVFPWVLRDYTSPELDLEDPQVYRDFSRPMGIQNHSLEEHVVERFKALDDPTRFHYGSHYSNAAGVLHYLIRLEPFTSLHIELQGGKFDYADRQFFSIQSAWETIYKTGTDVKELIPEFFYLPEFLTNISGYNLGKLQTGEMLDDVILPNWASSPEDFIQKHREALESEYVSAHLHEWLDLIFGYKQTGPEAINAVNVFNFYSYEDNVDLDSIQDPKERRQIESIINNFGQTPTQLFTEPHPQRLPMEVAKRNLAKGYSSTFTGRRAMVNLFQNLHDLKAHVVDISTGDGIVFVGTPSIQTRALLISGNPEQLVTVTHDGFLNVHGWLPFSNSRNRPFTFQFDPNAQFDKSKWQLVAGPFAQDLPVTPKLFVLSPNNKLLVTGGHWDNTFRVHSIEKGRLAFRVHHHNDIVTCMALDKAGAGEHFITGSRDTTCVIWKFGNYDSFEHPLRTLYGHDSEVICVDISTELDIAVSGAKDGTCIVHTVRHGHYMYTMRPRRAVNCEIHLVAISSHGRIIVYSEDTTARTRVSQVPPCLHLYTINGKLVQEKDLSECLNALVIVDRYLITGNNKGFLTFRDIFTLKQLSSLNLLECICSISVVLDHHTKICTHILVGLGNGRLIIVSVKDTLTAK